MTGPAHAAGRHTTAQAVDAYRRDGVAGAFAVYGAPPAMIRIAPLHDRLTLLVRVDSDERRPDLRDRAHISYELEHDAGTMWHRVDVTYDENLTEVYPVLCAIADRVQLGGQTFAEAVDAVLDGLGEILAGRGGLTHDQQVGLFGELAALRGLAAKDGPAHAVAAWRGPDREEHDLGLATADVEVKTTMSERRRHWISSATQLLSTPGRELYLLSMQITAAGDGPGLSLADLADAARALPQEHAGTVDASLAAAGYRDRHADLYTARWALRTAPEFHLVDDSFPAFTPERIAAAVPSSHRVSDLRYRIDLNGLPAAPPLFAVTINGETHA